MKHRRRFFHIASLCIMLVPLAVTSTPPHMDWYLFEVRGHVVRPAGSLDNYTVVVMRYEGWRHEKGWIRIGECIVGSVEDYGPIVSASLTDKNVGDDDVTVVDGYMYDGLDSLTVTVP